MTALMSKAKEYIKEQKLFLLFWLLVSIKVYFETSGSVAPFFSGKFFCFLFFAFCFALLLYTAHISFGEENKKAAFYFSGISLFIYYCCLNQTLAYSMQNENYISAAFLFIALAFAPERKACFFTVPACLIALFVSPETSALILPAVIGVICFGIEKRKKDEKPNGNKSVKKIKKNKNKYKKKKEQLNIFESIISTVSKIPPAVSAVILAVLFALSFVIYRARNPYDIMLNAQTAAQTGTEFIKIFVFFMPFYFLSLLLWICFIRQNRGYIKELLICAAASLACLSIQFVFPMSHITATGYISLPLIISLSAHTFILKHKKETAGEVSRAVKKFSFAAAVILIITVGAGLKYFR